jgi:KaiC/GvpD/RAD55 family RecA-like ATPase
MNGVDRVKTGIAGIDTMLYGGVPDQSQTLIAGGPGSGKTLLAFNILYNAAEAGTNAAFITFDEQPEAVIKNAKEAFPDLTDIDALIDSRKLIVDGTASALRITTETTDTMYSFGNIVSDLEGMIKSNDAKVVAIDSISLLKLMLGNPFVYYKSMLALVSNLKRIGVTTFLTTELRSTDRKNLRFSPEYFIFDGILAMYQSGEEERRVLTMEIIKMRGSNHSLTLSPYEITSAGFRIFTIEQ